MQKSFLVNAPDRKSVAVDTPYGIQVFEHGDIIYDERYAKVYPNMFFEIPQANVPESASVEEKLAPQLLTEESKKVEVPKKPAAPRKKPGPKPGAKRTITKK